MIESLTRVSSTTWVVVLLLALVAGKAVAIDNLDPDFFWHLRVAEQLREQGVGPLVDSISYNSTAEPWVPYSWLAQRFMLSVWEQGGVSAVVVVDAICSAAFVLLLGRACRVMAPGNPTAVMVGATVATLLSLSYTSFRPATFVLTLLAAVVYLVLRDRASRSRTVWICPFLFALAANLHLYAVVGAALVGAYAVGCFIDRDRHARRALVVAALCGAGSLMTPLLPGVIEQAFRYRAQDVMVASGAITEMRPFYASAGGMVLLAVVVGVLVAAIGARRARFAMLLPLGLATVLLAQWGRFAPVWALVAVPTIASLLPVIRLELIDRMPVKIALLASAAAAVVGVFARVPSATMPTDSFVARFEEGLVYPVGAAAFVESNIRPDAGRLINEFSWGGYLAWRLGDRYQVFVDGRTQLYDASFWHRTYVGTPTPSRELLASAGADAAVLPVERSRFHSTLRAMGWKEVYRDAVAVVLIPPPAATATVE